MAQAKRKKEKSKAKGAAKGPLGEVKAPPAEAGESAKDAVPAEPQAPVEPWRKPEGLSRRGWAILGAVVVLANFPVLHYALRGEPEASVSLPYQDDFSRRETVAEHYWNGGGHWRTINGELISPGVRNNPLWLKARLPNDVAVEFDVRSMSPEGDVKVELFGDGTDHASGYIFIHGGWGNTISVIARLDEHGKPLGMLQQESAKLAADQKLPSSKPEDTGVFTRGTHMRVEANPFKVEIGRTYHWRIERRGSLLSWFIDGKPFMSFDDPFPLTGPRHDRFGFSSWEADLYFDNLKVQAL